MPGIYVETTVVAGLDEVWQATQQPDSHVRWDLRFTSIVPTSSDADGRWSFRYSLRVLGIDVHGTGVSVGETCQPDGGRGTGPEGGPDRGSVDVCTRRSLGAIAIGAPSPSVPSGSRPAHRPRPAHPG